MSQLMRRDPVFGPVDRLFTTLLSRDPLFGNGGNALGQAWSEEEGTLALDVSDDGENVVVKASLPGFKREDVSLEVNEGVLTISAKQDETTEESGERFYRRERRFGSLSRRVALPAAVDQDNAQAELLDGVLTLRLPKAQRDLPRRIEIK